ncbi:MAG: hypothetical protein DK302_000359 [Chloroflexi bacterium]|jgi:hypothetical protein|nr:MAG: hypothetical protein DK302_000359 [Chloroflexota bacterium]
MVLSYCSIRVVTDIFIKQTDLTIILRTNQGVN